MFRTITRRSYSNPSIGLLGMIALQPQENVLINKIGSTNGFSAYAAFICKKMGIVLLATKSYPIETRVTATYQILSQLDAS